MTDVTVGGVGELVGIGEGVIVGHEECNIEACPKRWSPGRKDGHRGRVSRSKMKPELNCG